MTRRNLQPQAANSKLVIRCAIYTRKSTDEGLDQDFNTLDAQREAAESYIKSQKHEGWECIAEHYDDGGFSGGNLDRPSLRRLMSDIEAGNIDCVVVYKVDRLSRSLLDFARIMEIFDRRKVAFVSVTQQFNTSAPMGRLVLNVLLSFAQFEREIIGERIRDKIAAQRRRGKWSGGSPVLGYDVDRTNRSPKLILNSKEAKQVAAIFDLYLQLGSMSPVLHELEQRGWLNKSRITKKGEQRGGRPFDKSSLYGLLTNPIYVGKVRHKSALHAGEHEPIVTREVFEKFQARLKLNGRTAGTLIRNPHSSLLKGLLRCKACDRVMVHTFTDRGPKRYRYYTCSHAIHSGRSKCPSGSLPASQVEQLVIDQVRRIAGDPELRAEVHRQSRSQLDEQLAAIAQEQRDLERELRGHHSEMARLARSNQPSDASPAKAADLLDRITYCETKLGELQTSKNQLQSEAIKASEVEAAFADFDALWSTASPRDQAELLVMLVARVEYDVKAQAIAISFHSTGIKALAVNAGEKAA